jgi:hypothetical protein
VAIKVYSIRKEMRQGHGEKGGIGEVKLVYR